MAQTIATMSAAAVAAILTAGVAAAEGHSLPSVGSIVSATQGDRGCVLTMVDDDGVVFETFADADFCELDGAEGVRLQLTYETMDVPAASCEGDPACSDVDAEQVVTEAELAE